MTSASEATPGATVTSSGGSATEAAPSGPRSGAGPATWVLGSGDRDQLAGRVFALVLDNQLVEFLGHEPGVRADDDIEHLHAYRVSLRRSRSLLAAGRRVYPAEELELLKALTSQFAAYTSTVRDFDVLLEGLDARVERLTPNLRAGLPDLAGELTLRRGDALSDLIEVIDGDLHDVMVRRWQTMATVYRVGGSGPGPDAMRPTGDVVDRVIAQSFKRLRTAGKAAHASGVPADWHEVRKKLKRFRYLLGIFGPLYAGDPFKRVRKELAQLQNGMGKLQDHVAQVELIEAAGIAAGGRAALTSGALAEQSYRDMTDDMTECQEAWKRFDRKKTRTTVAEATSGA